MRDGTPVTFTMSGPSGTRAACPPPVAFAFGPAQSGWILYGDGRTDYVWPSGTRPERPGI